MYSPILYESKIKFNFLIAVKYHDIKITQINILKLGILLLLDSYFK